MKVRAQVTCLLLAQHCAGLDETPAGVEGNGGGMVPLLPAPVSPGRDLRSQYLFTVLVAGCLLFGLP